MHHLASFYDQKATLPLLLQMYSTLYLFVNLLPQKEHQRSEGHSIKGLQYASECFYDLQKHTGSDALILSRSIRKDEFSAFSEIVDRHDLLTGTKDVLSVTGAIVLAKQHGTWRKKAGVFLFRTKDPFQRTLLEILSLWQHSFDIQAKLWFAAHKKKISIKRRLLQNALVMRLHRLITLHMVPLDTTIYL